MYPNLTMPLVFAVGAFVLAVGWFTVRRPVARRLAIRQVARRRTEGALVVAGAVLGTAIIVGALVVGDTLGFSVRQVAYHTLGNVDERVVSTAPDTASAVARALAPLTSTRDVDGVVSAAVQQAAASRGSGDARIAEPRVLAWDVDFAAAARFGAASGPSGLSGPAPAPGQVIVNTPLASVLHLQPGSGLTLYLFGKPQHVVVSRIVSDRGLAGSGFGATQNRDVFLPPGALAGALGAADSTRWVTYVSNRGGVESGNALTTQVKAQIEAALGGTANRVEVETPKHDVLSAAKKTGDSLGSLFLMIGSFSIIAGALLLMNIFVMLAEERKSQLGMLRAAGFKRSHLVGSFSIEGTVYAVIAALAGIGVGVGVGRGVAYVAARIYGSWSQDGSGLDITFAVTGRSLLNGALLGLLISFVTIAATSFRISRFNIIAAIRDLPSVPARSRRRGMVAATLFAVLFAVASVPAVASSNPVGTFLFPALAFACAAPVLARRFGLRPVYTAVSFAVLAWTLLVNLVRPGVYDTPSMALYVVMGTLLALSAVLLVSENQDVVLRPMRKLIARPTERALSTRLAVAYPVAKRFRTGATLVMYSLVFLVLVLISEIGGVLQHSVNAQVASSTAGYAVRIDYTPGPAVTDLRTGPLASQISQVTPLTTAHVWAMDPGGRTSDPVDTLAVGVTPPSVDTMQFSKRLSGLTTDAAVWRDLTLNPDHVVLDAFFAATGGPPGNFYAPGDKFTFIDPRSRTKETKTIVGILRNATMFYSPRYPMSFPVIMSPLGATDLFGGGLASVTSALVRGGAHTTPAALAARLQGTYLSASLVATAIPGTIRKMFDANLAFFRLMDGFLALGLLIGICGLGVVMIRAVRERRRTIGVLRALGFRAKTVERSFLVESGFVAFEGVVIGGVLGILTTWLMYAKSAMFAGLRTGFPVMWGTATVLGVITVAMSLLATWAPARRAARILPALATRVE